MATIHAVTGFCRALSVVVLAGVAIDATRAQAAEVEPLRSTEVEAQLSGAGFDESQRARVLADHAAYVERFTEVVAQRLAEWQAIARTQPESIEEARALQAKSRAAAAAIDDAERPLLDAIRAVSRPDQAAALARVLSRLEIRRDLAIAAAIPSGFSAGRALDVRDAVDGLKLSAESMAKLEPVLAQYLVERQAAIHRIREATLGVPVKRFEAVAKHPAVAEPAPPRDGEPGTDMNAWMEQFQARDRAVRAEANAERNAARAKAVELDLRTIDALRADLCGRDQARLICRWWDGNAMMMLHRLDSGSGLLHRAWVGPKDGYLPGVAQQLDAICDEWISAWWPAAKEAATESSGDMGPFFFGMGDGDDAKSPKVTAANAATARAHEAITLAIDGKVAETATTAKGGAAGGGAAGGSNVAFSGGSVTVEGGKAGAQVETTVTQVATFVVGEVALDGVEFSFDGGAFEGEMFELDGGDGMMSFTVVGDGGAIMRPSPLPRLIDFDEIKPSLVAGGVDAGMLEVAKTAFDDLLSDANALVKEYEAAQAAQTTPADTFHDAFDRPARARRIERDAALRARLLAMEATAISDTLGAVVPAAGAPCVSWIAPWRQFVSERAALSGGDFFGMAGGQLDPTQAVRAANLAGPEWCAVGTELAAVCSGLAERSRAAVQAAEKAFAAMPVPTMQEDGNVSAVEVGATIASEDEFMRLQMKAQETKQAVRTAAMQSIPRLKALLPAEAAQRLQDAWDDQLYARDLKDATALTSRFDGALALELPEEMRTKVTALRASWATASRAARDAIVAIKARAQAQAEAEKAQDPAARKKASAERKVALQAAKFERDELNRRVFRELCALVGADNAARLPALPESKGKRGLGELIQGGFTTAPAVPAPEASSPAASAPASTGKP